jgi:hypothetical protein
MRLGVPFIAPRQLGAVESNLGRQFLPSVSWRTRQSGAPPDTVRCGFLSLNGKADRWQPESRWRTGHVRCTPDSPVPPSTCWLTGQSGAHRTFQGIIAVRRRRFPESGQFARAGLAHRTLSGAPPDSPVHPDRVDLWQNRAISFPIQSFLFPALRHNTLVHKQCTKSRNIPFDMICTLSTTSQRLTQEHLRWHSITKILRNGPRHISLSLLRALARI